MQPPHSNAEVLFHQALEIEPPKRAALLSAACGADTTLRRRVEALLTAHERAGGFLREGISEGAATAGAETPDTESIGTVIGRYKLLEKLGEGGFGVVWAAEQREPIRRRVALKIIKLGMDTKQVIARFEAERQALAVMDYPNIAKVLDAGATDAGRPYFVMELVRGIAITKYCDEEQLNIRVRLELFIKICHAIQHAHQKGIIHRDIKPANVLVTLHDGVPVPKVIDFGIAKATQAELTEKTVYTQYQQFIGTPAYMSPEQAEMSGLDIDTRSDIYSLGVLLYELLTGNTPFDGKELLASGLDEMRRIIREREPVRPSTKLNQTRAAAAKPGSVQSKIQNSQSEIDKDLDWIVMKCLEKDRTWRYETANGLAMDLKRHLNNETIIARPPSSAYRLRKAFRRNKLAFTAATMVATALILGLGLSTWMFLRERQARSESDQRAATINRNFYFTEMILAGQAATVPDGISRVAEITAKWRPEKGAVDHRGWEWYYLQSLVHFDLFTASGHTDAVMSVMWSPDGQRLASASADNTVKIWDAAGGRMILTLSGHTDLVNSVAWSPDASRLASASKDHTIKVWDTASGKNTLTLRGHTHWVNAVAWSPDGKRLASGSRDESVKVWNASTGTETLTLRGHILGVRSVAWRPDGTLLASASADTTLRVWDLDGESEPHILRGHPHPFAVNSVAWSQDGKRLASGGNDHDVIVWETDNTGSWTNVLLLKGHTQHVLSVAWSSDGKLLASAGDDHTIKIWEVASNTNTLTLRGHTGSVNSMHWSPTGTRLVSGSADQTVKVWNVVEQIMTLRGHTDGAFSVAWSPDGKRLASGAADNTIRLWDIATRTNILTLHGHTGCVFILVWSPEGKRLASGSFDKNVKIWHADGNTNVLTVRDHAAGLFSAAWNPDGRSLASSCWYETNFNIWDADSGQVIRTLTGHSKHVFSLAWSPDGKRLASASFDQSVRIWDPARAQVIHTLTGHTDVARSVAWSPNGKWLVSGGRDHTIKIWNPASGTNIRTLRGHTSEVVLAVWSPDGKRLASGSFDGTVRVWDPDTGHETLTLRGHTAQVQSIAWSPDGQRLASASRDHTIRIWDASKAYAVERQRSH